MSDLPSKNISSWQQHPSLLPYVEQGILDFARFDAVQDVELHLVHAKLSIRPGDLQQPLVIVANYFLTAFRKN